MWIDVLLVVGAYLYGAFPVVYLLGRMRGYDLRQEEDMHSGLWHKVGRVEGFSGIAWDVVKGGIAVALVDVLLDVDRGTVVGVGVAVVAGMMWSVFLGFEGEKGNTTSLGVAGALSYQALPFCLVPILLGVGIRTVPRLLDSKQALDERLKFGGPPSLSLPLGMLVAFALFPVGCWWVGESWETIGGAIAIFCLIVIKRVTDGLLPDLRTAGNKKSVLLNRVLIDRSYL